MDFIGNMVRFIKSEIPIEILDLALRDFKTWKKPVNLDTLIEKNILAEMVLDMNLSSGIKINIPYDNWIVTFSSDRETVIELKSGIHPGKSILSVTEIIAGSPTSRLYSPGITPIEKLDRSIGPQIYGIYGSDIETIGNRELYIGKPASFLTGSEIVCYLTYSKEMKEISPKYYMAFGEIAIIKAQAWIYNKLVVKLNEGELYHGHSLDIVNRIVDNWSDANKEYMEKMNVLGSKLLYMNDPRNMKNAITTLIDIT